MLDIDSTEYRSKIDSVPFDFSHRLQASGFLQLSSIRRLAATMARLRPDDVYYDAGRIDPGTRWHDMAPSGLSVDEALRDIETADTWVILRRVHLDPEFAPMLDACMADIAEAGGPALTRRMRAREALVIVSSPRRVTAYHMDRECGFLLQVQGNKQISLFDPTDRELLPEREIELFWTKDNNAPRYRPHLQARATVYELAPGRGVHIPINAPHWIQNGPDVSISVNINFLPSDNERANIYRANYHLRQIGLDPRPPFQSSFADACKRPLGQACYRLRQAYRATRGAMRRAG